MSKNYRVSLLPLSLLLISHCRTPNTMHKMVSQSSLEEKRNDEYISIEIKIYMNLKVEKTMKSM